MTLIHGCRINSFVQVFIGPLKGILNVNDIQKLFSNITIIHKFNETLLNQLETRMHGFSCKKTVIGDIFINIIPFLGVYCDYCCNYESAIQFSNLLRQSNPQYASFLQTTYESCKGYGLADLLIMPVQRIPRYKLLLDKLITLTSELHPDYELLNKAYELVSDKATDINKKMNIVTQQKVMMQLHTRFLQSYQLPGGIVQPWRYHICQFEAMWIKPNSCTASKIEFFIFNDIFIISTSPNMPEEKFECITAQPLWNSFILKPYEDWDFYKSYTNTFQVVNPTGAWILSFAHGDYLKVKNQFESARKEFLEQAQEKKLRRMDIKLLPLHEKQEYVAIEPLKGPLPPPIVPKDILQRNPSFEDIQDEDKGDGEVRTPKRSKLSKLRQELHSKTISPKKIIRKGHALTLKAPLTSKKLEQWNQSFNSENMDNSKFTPTKYQTLKSGSTNSSPIVPKKKRTKSTKMTPLKIRD